MSQADLARRAGLSVKHVNQIVLGLAPITAETALAFERVVGVPAAFWMRLEANYRAREVVSRERDSLDQDLDWLDQVPTADLVRRGLLPKTTDRISTLQGVLSFFGVASVGAWKDVWEAPDAAFLKSPAFKGDPYATAVWLRIGEREAAQLDCESFDRARFQSSVSRARSLTIQEAETFAPDLIELCRSTGVALVFVSEVKGTRASGATRWLSPTKAMIQLSLRHKRADHLWFSFFHECAHVLFHGKRQAFVDVQGGDGDDLERGANEFAAHTLIPQEFDSQLPRLISLAAIESFARTIGVAPGIVVGRLQHDGVIPMSFGNHLRRRLELVE
jgi:HTH-type transcriptional regulator/antitoxin HigA